MKIITGIILGAGTIFLLVLPFFDFPYWTSLIFTLLLNIALTGGVNLLWGFAGYMNLGYMAFFGLGAYGLALSLSAGYPFFSGLVICQLLLGPVWLVLALTLFRLQGLYFSAASLGVLILLEESAVKLSFLSGGPEGLSLSPDSRSFKAYFLSLALAGAALGINWILNKHKLGYQLRMIREDEPLAGSIGIPVLAAKVKTYGLGAALAGLAGGLYVLHSGYIGPASAFGLPVAVPPVIMALIGGGRKWWGPLLGAVILTGLQEFLWSGFNGWVLSAYGLTLIFLGLLWAGKDREGRSRLWLRGKMGFSKFF